nr:hypothetical protein [Acuticoccus mangrovi]
MLVEVQIPLLSPFVRYGFHKIARRSGDYGLALCLVVYERDEDEMVKVRVGLGGVEAVPRRLGAVEELLERRQPSRRLFREAADLAAEIADPLVTADGDEAYQRDLTRAVVTRALDRSLEG